MRRSFISTAFASTLAMVIGMAPIAAEEPLMTDVRLLIGTASSDYTVSGGNDHFSRSFEVAAQFLWSVAEIAPSGAWFLGAQGSFADRNDGTGSFSLSTLTLSGLAGYALSPEDMDWLHVELGVIGGVGGAIARSPVSDDLAPWIEGGVRAAAVVTWKKLQAGVDAGYRLGLTHADPGTGSADYLLVRGLVIGVSFGLRIE